MGNNNKGCKWLRFHAEQHAELCKVGKGAYLNCKKTCDSCVVPSLLPSAVPSLLPSAVPSSLPSVPTASPTTCGDLNLATFTIKKYNDAGTFKSEKEGRKCKKLAEKNDITIQNNCAANTIIANDCKLTCDNCDNPTASPTTCGDLNLATFTIKKYNDAGTFKSELEGRKCQNLAEKNDITIQNNCAANTIIANDCKLTCDNCDIIV